MLVATGLRKSYRGQEVLHGVDLEVAPGQVVGLLGANGAGKTTTIKQLAGLIEPSKGQVMLDGHSTMVPATRSRIGYLPEESALYDEQTAMAYLQFFGSLYGLSRKTAEAKASELLDRLGLAVPYRKRIMGTYSKGMRRKVAIARTLLHDPDVVILDEPTSGLDPFTARGVSDFIRELRGEGKAILLSAHNLHQVEEVCDHIIIMSDGRIVTQGSLDGLRKQWGRTRYHVRATQAFAGSRPDGAIHEATYTNLKDVESGLAAIRETGGEVLEVESAPPKLEEILRKAAEA